MSGSIGAVGSQHFGYGHVTGGAYAPSPTALGNTSVATLRAHYARMGQCAGGSVTVGQNQPGHYIRLLDASFVVWRQRDACGVAIRN